MAMAHSANAQGQVHDLVEHVQCGLNLLLGLPMSLEQENWPTGLDCDRPGKFKSDCSNCSSVTVFQATSQ